jgi:hypothetical protein
VTDPAWAGPLRHTSKYASELEGHSSWHRRNPAAGTDSESASPRRPVCTPGPGPPSQLRSCAEPGLPARPGGFHVHCRARRSPRRAASTVTSRAGCNCPPAPPCRDPWQSHENADPVVDISRMCCVSFSVRTRRRIWIEILCRYPAFVAWSSNNSSS